MSKFIRKAKLCECGCGKKVNWNKAYKRWNRFIRGHHNSILEFRITKMGNKNVSKRPEVRKKMSLARKGKYLRENNLSWKGGFYINKKGIKIINVQNRGDVAEARLIAEKALGRYLTSNEIVHHINEDKTNNSNNNLLVCNKSYHLFLHRKMNPNAYKNIGKQSKETKEKRAKSNSKAVMVNWKIYSSMKEATKKSKLCFLTIRKRIFQNIDGYTYLKGEFNGSLDCRNFK